MAAVVSFDTLLQQRRLWRGRALPAGPKASQTTGLAALDAVLPGGGWPEAALIEVLLPAQGVGELRLLLPTLARLTQAARPVVWVDPPHAPYAPALAGAGMDLRWLQLVEGAAADAPWVFEQCLRSRACAAVLGWARQADERQLRRWQVAAEQGAALGFLFRPESAAQQASPAALRLRLRAGQLDVLKCRGGLPPPRPIALPQ